VTDDVEDPASEDIDHHLVHIMVIINQHDIIVVTASPLITIVTIVNLVVLHLHVNHHSLSCHNHLLLCYQINNVDSVSPLRAMKRKPRNGQL
jgi:hypothetical protein